MVRGLNKVQIIGNLGRDPEMRYTPSGTAVTNFTVAVGRQRRTADNQFVDETEWFRVVTWEKLAETCDKWLHKGSQVYIEGRLQTRKYNDKDGVERTAVELIANEMIMLGQRSDNSGDGGAGTERQAAGSATERPRMGDRGSVELDNDDGVPF